MRSTFEMIIKMTALITVYIALSVVMWKVFAHKKKTVWVKILIGVVYGCASILATHFGVDYQDMILNIRDVGPLSAGLFFDPVSGIIAGLIGGIERFIAGTFWDVGSYTRLACSLSTVAAGFLAAFLRKFIFKNKLPLASSAFFVGAVMEVFHMYAVFLTHHDDMNMAFYVVKICAGPMIICSGIALAATVIFFRILDEKSFVFFKVRKREERPLMRIIQFSLLIITSIVLVVNLLFAFTLQTSSAEQNAQNTLSKSSTTIRNSYQQVSKMLEQINQLAADVGLSAATLIARDIMESGGLEYVDEEFANAVCAVYDLVSVDIVDAEGNVIAAAGKSKGMIPGFQSILDGETWSSAFQISDDRAAASVSCDGGLVQVVISTDRFASSLNFDGISKVLSSMYIGNAGFFDIIDSEGTVAAGSHERAALSEENMQFLKEAPSQQVFKASIFGIPSLCWKEEMEGDEILLTQLAETEVYSDRDAQAYETALADILIFGVIYAAIDILIQYLVIDKLRKINRSLGRITAGQLDEVVDVRSSREFTRLSEDINTTVEALKGYITAAEKRMEQEMEMAKAIQESALPRNFTFPRSEFELYASMNPARQVGGDFYDFFFVDQHKLALVIADVSGKGVPAALFMMRGKTQIQNLAKAGISPAEIMFQANNSLCEGNDTEMFITAWIGILELETGLMKCANAGHEYPALMRAGGEYELYKDKHGLVLGGMEDAKFREYELQLSAGDRLFVYTDGIPEAINEKTEQYGTGRLTTVLNTLKDCTEQETLEAVLKDIREFAGEAEQFDDITMLGITCK